MAIDLLRELRELGGEYLVENKQTVAIGAAIFFSYIVLHIVFGRHRLPAYDAYTYISFAQNYAENWFTTVVSGQAHGIEIVSYPPLVFQLMALLSFLPLVELGTVYIVLVSLTATAFSFVFYYVLNQLLRKDRDLSKILILFIGFSPGLIKYSIVHGQLPFLAGLTLGFLTLGLFLETIEGKRRGILLTLALTLTAYTHHFSFVMTLIILAIVSLTRFRDTVSQLDYLTPIFLSSAVLAFIGLYPMLIESLFGISQGRIFHGSRLPFESITMFKDYVLSTYGITVLGLPLLFSKKFQFLTTNSLIGVFLVLGLGLTTPVPEILFRGLSDFMVYDRFSLIASLFLSGLMGLYIMELSTGYDIKKIAKIGAALFVLLGVGNVFWANNLHLESYTGYGGFSEEKAQTAAEYLDQNASENYLYVTHDFEPPVAEIRQRTDVPTLETGYYQGRSIEEFRSLGKLDRLPKSDFMKVVNISENVSLKYILSFSERTNRWMMETDWKMIELEDDVTVWKNSGDMPAYEAETGKKRILFAVTPIFILLISSAVLLSEQFRSELNRSLTVLQEKLKHSVSFFKQRDTRYILLITLPFVAAIPSFITRGLPSGIDTPLPLFKREIMSQMMQQYGKIFYWSSEWYNGYPFHAMYPPLGGKIPYLFSSVLGNTTVSYNFLRLLILVSTTAVIYKLSKKVFDDRRIQVFSIVLAVFSYPIYSNLYTVGRLSSALALPIYLSLIYLVTQKDIFQRELSVSHLFIGIAAGMLFLANTMMAYLFCFTGAIFLIVYRDRLPQLGLKPVVLTSLTASILSAPYIARMIQHIGANATSWYVEPVKISISTFLKPEFSITPPVFQGWIYTSLAILGLLNYSKAKEKFFKFCLINFSFFFAFFWLRNSKIASQFIPFAGQLDLARLQMLFTVFGLFIALYGLKWILYEKLDGLENYNKNLLVLLFAGLVVVNASPMLVQSANWSPNFSSQVDELSLDDDYRSMGVGMRVWDSYLLEKMNTSNVFGWFNQADPNPRFRKNLQSTGGAWYGWNTTHNRYNSTLQKNLMEISNTKYIVSTKGKWLNKWKKQQVVGPSPLPHHLNQELLKKVRKSEEFKQIHSSKHLEVHELERDMSYCQKINPVWIQENYEEKSLEFFQTSDALPEFPVKGQPRDIENRDMEVNCHKEDPYTISVNANGTGWILVKESYYPFWERSDGGDIIDGYGFQVLHVSKGEEITLKYQPRKISTLSPEDITGFTKSIFS